ncbi:MAG: LamG domain-containing protein, partial [Verrucomicrobia bacterium]|nr:LamG domain-containing protein [Verrucomicrobiota bacterium]
LPNGKITRTIKQGTPKIDDWNDPLNHTTQVLQLSGDGIREISRTEPGHSPPAKPIVGNPLRGDAVIRPVREWRFDEAAGDRTVESITGEPSDIAGHKSLWRKGVSGTCLQFDDYTLTLEGWFAIGAYPWNWAPIVQQGDDTGYFLGVDGHGRAGFKLKVGDTWQELVATNVLDRFHWHHAAGTYDPENVRGAMSLYLDGKLVATRPVGAAGITTVPEPIQIGKGKPRRPVDPVRASTFTASYSFDGLIDEVRIYDQALTPEQIAASCQKFLPPPDLEAAPDMDRRALPQFNTGGRFGAHYTRLKFYDVWDNLWRVGPYADVVVGFDQSPAKFVFWRGAGHIPMLVNEADQWYSNEFNETVIENTPARVVVQWRFPLVDVRHVIANYHPETGWGDWSDWYYYIYPDGVAVKTMQLWTDGPRNHEWHESMAILGPNQHPEQVLETDPALILADLEGNPESVRGYSWKQGPPKVDFRNQKIHVVNYRAQYDPFTIGDFTGGNVYGGERTPYSVFPSWNHWPVAQIPSDGRYASFPDRAAHSSLTHVFLPDFRAESGDRPFQEKLLMEGMSKLGAQELAPLARSWLQAPEIESLADCRDQGYPESVRGYDPAQRAYVLSATGAAPSFRIAASAARPIVNPCFVVRNWNCEDLAQGEINSETQSGGPKLRQGIVRDPNGKSSLVVWLQHEATVPTTFTLRGARPEAAAGKGGARHSVRAVPNQNSRTP